MVYSLPLDAYHLWVMHSGEEYFVLNQKGFTLVEIIAVLIILSVLAAMAVPRYIDLEENARQRAIDAAISELNGRERLHWSRIKITLNGFDGDANLWATLDKYLGDNYEFENLGNITTNGGGNLRFKEGSWVSLSRAPSTTTQPAQWKRAP